ncbi:DUF6338 family protein [Planococcus sp. 11815]
MLLFVVPGFIIDSVIRRFIPVKNSAIESSYLRFLLFSCYHYGVYAIPIYYLFINDFYESHPLLTISLFLFIMFGSPLMVGSLLVFIRSKRYHETFFEKIKVKPIKSIPIAWDYFFNKTESTFVIIYFKDGTIINGKFGSSSYASSLPSERDLYLESICEVDDEGNWEIKRGSNGVLIKSEEIKAIEFLKGGE